jgi:hypothetical protein
VNLWQWFGLLATTACVLLVFSLNRQQKKDFYFEANTNQPYVVRLLAGELQEGLITQARITLPNGVNIHSKQFPELNDQQQVTLNWESGLKVEHFPLVIVGNTEGEKELTVQFLDSSGNVLVERQVLVKFIRSKENV